VSEGVKNQRKLPPRSSARLSNPYGLSTKILNSEKLKEDLKTP
jgi:hypothetical protein